MIGVQAFRLGGCLASAGGGREELVAQLLARYPNRFAVPRRVSDRRPAVAGRGGEREAFSIGSASASDVEVVKPEQLARMAGAGQLLVSMQESSGAALAIPVDAVVDVAASGKVAVVEVGTPTQSQLLALKQHAACAGAFVVGVCREAALPPTAADSMPAADATVCAVFERGLAQLQELLGAHPALFQARDTLHTQVKDESVALCVA
jgi:hypothetical protein